MIRHPETIYTLTRRWALYVLPECRVWIPGDRMAAIVDAITDDSPHPEAIFN